MLVSKYICVTDYFVAGEVKKKNILTLYYKNEEKSTRWL